jgi:cobalt-zinc-cadmium efflux system protein
MFTDTLAIALSLGAVMIALRPPTEEQTFGFLRAEILAALVNGATLVVVAVLIFYEAARRLLDPPEIDGPLMLMVAFAGLAANGAGMYLLHDRSRVSLNVRGAFLHMFGDLLSSIGVIVGGLLIVLFDLKVVDPVLSVLIGAIVLVGAWKLVTQSTSILLESVPSHIKLKEVRAALVGVDGVVDVRDLHVWTLSSGMHALSARLVVEDRLLSECSDIMRQSEGVLSARFGITHTTLQVECGSGDEAACSIDSERRG